MKQKINYYKFLTYFHYLISLLLLVLLIVSFIFWVYIGAILILIYYLFNLYYFIFDISFSDLNYQDKRIWFIILLFLPGTGSYLFLIFKKNSDKKFIEKQNISIIKNGWSENDDFFFKKDNLNLVKQKIFNSKIENFILEKDLFFINDKSKEIDFFISEIKKAKKEICLFLSSLDYGIVWKKIEEELFLKLEKNENFQIIFLLDYFAINSNNKKIIEKFKNKKNIHFSILNKIHFYKNLTFKKFHGNLNFVIIDQKIVYLNSLLLTEKNDLFSKNGFMFNSGFKLKNNSVNYFNSLFNYFFSFKNLELAAKRNQELLKLKTTENFINNSNNIQFYMNGIFINDSYYKSFINLINSSNTSIDLIVPNLFLLNDFKNLLIDVLKRNIKLRIIVSETENKSLKTKLSRLYEQEIISLGGEIFKLKNSGINTILLIIDNKLISFSTSNFKYDSIFDNLNIYLISDSKEMITKANLFLNNYLKISYKETSNYLKWSIFKQFWYKIVILFYPFL
ncbi:cardiolipin synthetase [Candidatus Hepatoplasma crinochetorum Av]|uniref:Cardiolipin synthetase n=1 Tax=Candidatus Hepatoplasma crinochetorum Av TaxID=1427984 RepID=W8GEB7_9MOLU|nr:phospholipase D-like domain-containing protein [Candidatus Hepatoplasma crinochetorum]AHK22154.1 cardiolipin synthetase [Candidatus Hepatoplasma crinochetorum Av]